jgi:PmbA protein
LIQNGVLKTFLYDTYYANKHQTEPTGHAQRSGYRGTPHAGASFLRLSAGSGGAALDLVARYPRVFLVTRGLGSGLDIATGHYSRGMNGLFYEQGELVHPVHEVTLAGHFTDMLSSVDCIGDDVLTRGHASCPSLSLREATIGGRAAVS